MFAEPANNEPGHLLNAAAVLWAAGQAADLPEARQLAEQAIDSKKATRTLDSLVRFSQQGK